MCECVAKSFVVQNKKERRVRNKSRVFQLLTKPYYFSFCLFAACLHHYKVEENIYSETLWKGCKNTIALPILQRRKHTYRQKTFTTPTPNHPTTNISAAHNTVHYWEERLRLRLKNIKKSFSFGIITATQTYQLKQLQALQQNTRSVRYTQFFFHIATHNIKTVGRFVLGFWMLRYHGFLTIFFVWWLFLASLLLL